MPGRGVLVIGGGLAGLAAATALAEAGVRVTVVEGSGGLGGRARSVRHARTGDEIDTGQHVLMGCYDEMFRFLDRIGSRHLVRTPPRLDVPLASPRGDRARLACPALPPPWHLAVGLLRHDHLTLTEKLGTLRVLGDARARWDSPALDRLTTARWLASLGQSPDARRYLWDPLCLACLNASPEVAPASLFAVVLVRAFMAGGDASSIALATVGLTSLYGPQATEYVEARGGRVLLNQPVSELVVSDGRCRGAIVRAGRRLEADAVVAAVPAPALQRMLPPALRRESPWSSLPLFEPSPIVSAHAWLDRPILEVPFLGVVDADLHWVFDRERTWGAAASGGHLVTLVSSGADHLAAAPKEAVFEALWRDLEAAVPDARAARVLDWLVVKERAATFRARPGLARHRFGPGTPLPGLLVAGDWTDTGLPATMEGACASGHAAAALRWAARGETPARSAS